MQETIRIADGAFEERLGYKFSTRELLERALTHSSAVPELRAAGAEEAVPAVLPRDNERLEFLGDAVLELLASEYLLSTFPEWSEGQLSKSRARIVNAGSLEAAARRQGIRSIADVEECRLETGGALTFVPKLPTPEDTQHNEVIRRLEQIERGIEALARARS